MATKNITFNLDEELIKELKRVSYETDRTQKSIITEFIRDGVEKLDNQANRD